MKKSIRNKIILLIVSFLTILISSASVPADEKTEDIYLIPISGTIDPGMFAFIKRAINEIPPQKARTIIFEMDTFGGRVDSALQIVDTITSIKNATTIAFVKTKAISAGALISLSCNRLVMKPGTTIGDCAPITYGQGGPKMLGEKFQSPLRAKFRTLAKKNGYNVKLAEAMVSQNLEIFKVVINNKTKIMNSLEYEELPETTKKKISSKKTLVKKGELLTMDDKEAKQLGFSKMSAETPEAYLATLNMKNFKINRTEKSLTEKLLLLVIKFSPILMAIGLGAVFVEIKAPGFGAPGIIGLICLSFAIFSQYVAGLAGYTEILLIALGLVLIGFEIFVIPGFGIAGISGFLFITSGLILSLQDFTIPDPKLPWQADILTDNFITITYTLAGAILVSIMSLKFIIPKLGRILPGPYLETTLEKAHADSSSVLRAEPGLSGIAGTYLRPSGKMNYGNEVFDVITEGDFIEKGSEIVISRIDGNRIIVKRK